MNAGSALRSLRLGCVQYLNARPLIHGCDADVIFDHPSRLATMLAAGELDAGLVPVFELFQRPDYLVVDGVSIASNGPVHSVFLAHRGELRAVREIALDPASLTSTNLLRVVLAEFHGLHPRCVGERAEAEARLLIGNQAIRFRRQEPPDWRFLDLGAEWTARTGLPFVYALWLLRPDLENPAPVADALRALKISGLAALDEIVASEVEFGRDLARRYLTQHIRFDFGDAEKAGLAKYRELLVKHSLAPPDNTEIRYC